jgi:cob(I)alamin adenosyltransferase
MTWIPEDRAPRRYQDTAVAKRKGLIMVYTGDGKGKTTAALGLAFRALGRRYRVAVVQFIKGAWKTGEAAMAKELAGRIEWHALGDGFTWITKNYEQDVASARAAWAKCCELLADERYQVVIFDELSYVLKYNFLSVDEVLEGLARKPPQTHVVITGRDAPPALIERADLVTEMREIKHPYRAGLKAQPGVDY